MKRAAKPTPTSLPEGVLETDRAYPKKGGVTENLTFYKTNRFGWCIATLSINNRGRTYGITADDGRIVTMGGRPDDVTVYVWVHAGNQKRLQKFVDLKAKGLGNAGDVRDRIGSRRAQGQVERAAGRRSWRWDI